MVLAQREFALEDELGVDVEAVGVHPKVATDCQYRTPGELAQARGAVEPGHNSLVAATVRTDFDLENLVVVEIGLGLELPD